MIYILNIILTIFWDLVFLEKREPKKKLFIVMVSIQAILISGLRGLSIGADTKNYSDLFWYYKDCSWNEIFRSITDFVTTGNYNTRDMGYYIFTKLFGTLIPSYRIYLFVVIILFMCGLGMFLYKYSKDICLSYIIFDAFMFQFYGLTGIRQTLATILVLFIGYKYIKEKKLFKFILICLIASTVHTTSIIFLPFYFVCNIRPKKIKYLLTAIAAVGIIAFKKTIAANVSLGIYASMYTEMTGITSYNFIIMMALVSVVTFILDSRVTVLAVNNRDFVDGTLIAFLLVTSSIIFDLLFRLAWFYLPFLLVLIPEILLCLEEKSRRIVKIVLIVFLTFLLYKNHLDYTFFWME